MALGVAVNAAQDRMKTIKRYGNVDLGNPAYQSIMMGADTMQNDLDMRNQKSLYTPSVASDKM